MRPSHPLTSEGKNWLQNELQQLVDMKLPAAEATLRSVREDGDSYSPAHVAAQQHYGYVLGRIDRLTRALNDAQVVDTPAECRGGAVTFGSRVTVAWEDGVEEEFVLVGTLESDPARRRISPEAPMGKALLGQQAGAHVEVPTPAATLRFTIKHVC